MTDKEEMLGKLLVLESKMDYLSGLVIDHIKLHEGDKARIAIIETRLNDETHAADARLQKTLVYLTGTVSLATALITGLIVHLLHW